MAKARILPLICVEEGGLPEAGLSATHSVWAAANGFAGQRGRLLALPGDNGALDGYLFGTGEAAGRPALVTGIAGAALGPGSFRLEGVYGDPTLASIGFRLGGSRSDDGA